MGKNSGGKYGAETIPTFGDNGKLTSATIVLGTEFAKKQASGEYPIGSKLTPNDREGGFPVSREARAVDFLAHEFGHVEDAQRMGGEAWQRDTDILQANADGLKAMGQPKWINSPEYRKLLSECGCTNPSSLGTQREIRADGATIGVLRDYYGKGAGHGSMPSRVKKAIQDYEKAQ